MTSSTRGTAKVIDNPVLGSAIEGGPFGSLLSADQHETDQSQASEFPLDFFTDYNTPNNQPVIAQAVPFAFLPTQLEIDRTAPDQPAAYQVASGDSTTVGGLSDMVFTAPLQISQEADSLEFAPVSGTPLEVTEEVMASFARIANKECYYGIYGTSANEINFETKECDKSEKLDDFSVQLKGNSPCLGVRRTRKEGRLLSILYYEIRSATDEARVKTFQYGRPDFEASLRQKTGYQVVQKVAQGETSLRTVLEKFS